MENQQSYIMLLFVYILYKNADSYAIYAYSVPKLPPIWRIKVPIQAIMMSIFGPKIRNKGCGVIMIHVEMLHNSI